jgi:hypothetical protein
LTKCSRIRVLADEGPEEKCRFLRPVGELLDGSTVGVATPYVVSFSDDGKLRSQWEKCGDGGIGFSIAFDLRQSSTLFGEGTSVLKIAYDPTVQPNISSATIEEHWNVPCGGSHCAASRGLLVRRLLKKKALKATVELNSFFFFFY